MERIILIGCGGHAASVLDSIRQGGRYEIAGCIDREGGPQEGPAGLPVIGTDRQLKEFFHSGIRNAVVSVGYLGQGDLRERIYENLKQIGFCLPPVIDPSAVLAEGTPVGEGAYIGKRAVVNTGARIGRMCIVNTGAVIEHGNDIGEFSHIAVGAVLCGGVKAARRAFVGAGAVVTQGVCIGEGAVVGAGTVVRHHVEAGLRYYGR